MRKLLFVDEHTLSTAETSEGTVDLLSQIGFALVKGPLDLLDGDVLEFTSPRQTKDVVDGILLELRVFVSPLTHPEAAEDQILEDQKSRRQRHWLLGHRTIRNELRSRGKSLRQGRGILTTDAVESESDGLLALTGELIDNLLETARQQLRLGHHGSGAQIVQILLQRLRLLGGWSVPDDVESLDAPLPRQLDGSTSNTAVGTVLDQPFLSLAQPVPVTEVLDHAVGSDGVDADGADLEGRQALLVDLDELRFLHLGVRSPGALSCALHDDPVALLEVLNARTGRDDFEGALVSTDGRRHACAQRGVERRFAGVDALDLVDIRGVQRRSQQTEGDL